MADSPFLAFAERHDLDYAERIRPTASGDFPLRRGEATDLVGGVLPGVGEGLVARLRREAEGSDAPAELAFVVTRIRESVDFARFITCFEAGFRGVVSRAIGAGGLGWVREFTFESIDFDRRYRVAMLRTGKESRLRQLFSPVFLDWMAEAAPDGLYFDLVSGVLTVTLAGESVREAGDVERACELAGHIAERIRAEALEGTLDDAGDPEADAALAQAEARFAAQIERAGFRAPPSDVRSALERLGPVVEGEKGFLGRLFGSKNSTEATMFSLLAMLRSYADRAGLDVRQPGQLHELLPFLDHFPLPVIRQHLLFGRLPGTTASGALVALLDLTSPGSGAGLRYRPAVEIEDASGDGGFIHVLPRAEPAGVSPSVIGGFSVALGDGAERVTSPTRRERADAAAFADSLGGGFDVVAHRRSLAEDGAATRDWVASGDGAALVFEGGKLTLVGAATPVVEWSFGTLDEFCASAAPVIVEIAPAAA